MVARNESGFRLQIGPVMVEVFLDLGVTPHIAGVDMRTVQYHLGKWQSGLLCVCLTLEEERHTA